MYLSNFNNFEPKDFLEISRKFDKMHGEFNENISALTRTIISRIYYAAFLYVRQWAILHLDYISKPYKDHRQLPKFIAKQGPFSKSLNNEISSNLITLKKLRQQADYDLKMPNFDDDEYENWVRGDTELAFKLANKIFDSFENLE